MKKSNSGFSLMEALIGISLFGGLTTAFVGYQISQQKVTQKEKLSANLSAFKTRAINTINNDASWLKTAELASNASQVKCIGSVAGCSSLTSSYDMELYQADGSLLFSKTAVAGFQLNGTACASTANCPIQLELQWKPICSNPATSGDTNCKFPLIHITGNFVATDLPEVDVKKFNFSVMRSPSQISPCDNAPPSCGSQQALCTYTGWSCLPTKPTHCIGTVTWNDSTTGYGPCSNNVVAPGVLHDTSITLANTAANRNGSASFSCVPGDPSINNTGFNLSSATPHTCEPIIDGQCGLAHNTVQSVAPSAAADLCSAGTRSFISGTNPWSWSCAGSGGGTDTNCITAAPPTPPTPPTPPITLTNGQCGSAHNTTRATAPTTATELCSAGTASNVAGTNPWSWSCNGSNGGTNDNCLTNSSTPQPEILCWQASPPAVAVNTSHRNASGQYECLKSGICTTNGQKLNAQKCNEFNATDPPPSGPTFLGAGWNMTCRPAISLADKDCAAPTTPPPALTCPFIQQRGCSGPRLGTTLGLVSIVNAVMEQPTEAMFLACQSRGGTCLEEQAVNRPGDPVVDYKVYCHSGTASITNSNFNGSGTWACDTPLPPKYSKGADSCMNVGSACTSTEALHDSGNTFIVDICGCTFKNQMSTLFNTLTPRATNQGDHTPGGQYNYTVKCIGGVIHAFEMACANLQNGVCQCR